MSLNTIQKARPERVIAREQGLPTYFTGRPCKHGHLADRFTVDASCTECRKLFKEAYREQASAIARQCRAEMLSIDPEGTRAKWARQQREIRMRDPERVRERERHHGRLKRQRYPQRKLAETRKRQVAMIQRIPPWADLKVIREFYENCPKGMVVDHVAPLRGKTVSGLHVLGNLQYLTKEANLLKGNRFIDDWQEAV